jgi:hypothetical protein
VYLSIKPGGVCRSQGAKTEETVFILISFNEPFEASFPKIGTIFPITPRGA